MKCSPQVQMFNVWSQLVPNCRKKVSCMWVWVWGVFKSYTWSYPLPFPCFLSTIKGAAFPSIHFSHLDGLTVGPESTEPRPMDWNPWTCELNSSFLLWAVLLNIYLRWWKGNGCTSLLLTAGPRVRTHMIRRVSLIKSRASYRKNRHLYMTHKWHLRVRYLVYQLRWNETIQVRRTVLNDVFSSQTSHGFISRMQLNTQTPVLTHGYQKAMLWKLLLSGTHSHCMPTLSWLWILYHDSVPNYVYWYLFLSGSWPSCIVMVVFQFSLPRLESSE